MLIAKKTFQLSFNLGHMSIYFTGTLRKGLSNPNFKQKFSDKIKINENMAGFFKILPQIMPLQILKFLTYQASGWFSPG